MIGKIQSRVASAVKHFTKPQTNSYLNWKMLYVGIFCLFVGWITTIESSEETQIVISTLGLQFCIMATAELAPIGIRAIATLRIAGLALLFVMLYFALQLFL